VAKTNPVFYWQHLKAPSFVLFHHDLAMSQLKDELGSTMMHSTVVMVSRD
jgi:hypothetical protein